MRKTKRVLGDDAYAALNRLLKSCAETREFCQSCRSCHIDTDAESDKNDEQERIATAIKRVHFPDRV